MYVDENAETAEDRPGEAYVDMASSTPVMSNPEYFTDDFADAPSINAHSPEVGRAQQRPTDNYYNYPPPAPPPTFSRSPPPSAAVQRQTSQV